MPPAASRASRTREPAGSRTTPGCATAPTTSTTTAPGVGAGGGSVASTTGGGGDGLVTRPTPAPSRARAGTARSKSRGTREGIGRGLRGRALVLPPGRHRQLRDPHRERADGRAVHLEVEPVVAVGPEAEVV